ncbi:DUF2634 domain-containing protein [Virgibacillus dokdonensis]|uniref:Phage portal protein n=1 Tax=Virgibacillus dokdonensis TaxID=302167 RepID=A0A2K9IZR4_9BACI|nr:DUF2634 domain-containing protein [Virgibacillus dokdonensis]AUJ25198.1 hypothetical protein A21D_02134 [Virgibacillus dokdonensis]
MLSPELDFEDFTEDELKEETSRTYRIDFEKGEVTNEIIYGLEAIQQYIYMALRTPRFSHSIYSDEIGSEIDELLSDKEVSVDFIEMEIPRLVEEALIYDERISSVGDFELKRIGEEIHVKFTVTSIDGEIEVEEVL